MPQSTRATWLLKAHDPAHHSVTLPRQARLSDSTSMQGLLGNQGGKWCWASRAGQCSSCPHFRGGSGKLETSGPTAIPERGTTAPENPWLWEKGHFDSTKKKSGCLHAQCGSLHRRRQVSVRGPQGLRGSALLRPRGQVQTC